MFSSKDGRMIILSSPSGAGKTTLVKKLSTKKKYKISVSHTTREPRINEVNGVDYFFVSKEDFNKMIKDNAFLEYAEVFENLYGSTKDQVFQDLENGYNVLFDIDWQGTEQIKNQTLNYKLVTFFILPPSREVLHQRLISRGESNEKIIKMRMEQFDKDVLKWEDYDYAVINDDLESCYNEIVKIINSNMSKKLIGYNKQKIENHIKKLLV